MTRNLLFLLGLGAVLALSAVVWGVPDDDKADPMAGATYLGEKACKKCHMKQHRAWKKMLHKSAWDNLPEQYRALDQKDSDGRACVSCHVTGYGEADKGGFESVEKSGHLLGVQCESCHGAGSKHVEKTKAMAEEKRKKFNEGEETFIILKTDNCADCHNPHVNHKKKYGPK